MKDFNKIQTPEDVSDVKTGWENMTEYIDVKEKLKDKLVSLDDLGVDERFSKNETVRDLFEGMKNLYGVNFEDGEFSVREDGGFDYSVQNKDMSGNGSARSYEYSVYPSDNGEIVVSNISKSFYGYGHGGVEYRPNEYGAGVCYGNIEVYGTDLFVGENGEIDKRIDYTYDGGISANDIRNLDLINSGEGNVDSYTEIFRDKNDPHLVNMVMHRNEARWGNDGGRIQYRMRNGQARAGSFRVEGVAAGYSAGDGYNRILEVHGSVYSQLSEEISARNDIKR